MVSENAAAKCAEFCSVVCDNFFHNAGFRVALVRFRDREMQKLNLGLIGDRHFLNDFQIINAHTLPFIEYNLFYFRFFLIKLNFFDKLR